MAAVFSFHDELNPRLWAEDGEHLRPEVRQKLLEIAARYLAFLKFDLDPVDVIFTGSSANYNYSDASDIDLHLVYDPVLEGFVDGLAEPLPPEVAELFLAKKTLWNEHHTEVSIKGHPVELYAQDDREAHFATGVYSVLNDHWLRQPDGQRPEVDTAAVRAKAADLEGLIDHALAQADDDDPAPLEAIKERIRRLRAAGLAAGGEFSVENLAFKVLRSNGYLEKLADASGERLDRELSLESWPS